MKTIDELLDNTYFILIMGFLMALIAIPVGIVTVIIGGLVRACGVLAEIVKEIQTNREAE